MASGVQACKAPSHGQVHSKGSPELENDSLHGYDSWHIRACSPSSSSALGAVHTAMSQDLAVARSEAERLQLELHTVESRFEDKLRSLRKQVRIYIFEEKCARCVPQSWCLISFRTAAAANHSVIMHEWLLCALCILLPSEAALGLQLQGMLLHSIFCGSKDSCGTLPAQASWTLSGQYFVNR
jgi:hypothetical protein